MSVTGLPPQDLGVSNLVVKDTSVATQVTTLSITGGVVGVDPPVLQTIINASSGLPLATIMLYNLQNAKLIFAGPLNNSGNTVFAGSLLGYIPDYNVQNDIHFDQPVFDVGAATIEKAMISVPLTLTTQGELYSSIDVPSDIFQPVIISVDGNHAPCNTQNGWCRREDGKGCESCYKNSMTWITTYRN